MNQTLLSQVVSTSYVGGRFRRAALLLAAAAFGLSACSDDEVSVPETAATVEVTPRLSSVVAGQTRQLAAQAKDAKGANLANEAIVWRSLDTTVARVSQAGLVTAIASGATAITATTRGASGFATIDAAGVVASVEITGVSRLPAQQTVQLSASALEVNGRALFRPIEWASSNPTVATVSNTGLVTTIAVAGGTTNITATADGRTATFAFTVLPLAPVATITLTIGSGFLPTNVGVPVGVTLRDAAGGLLTGRTITYVSSNPATATVSATGVVTALTAGANVTITATSEGRSVTGTFATLNGLRSGTALTFGGVLDQQTLYAVYVPAGSTSLNVILRGGTGDPDLYTYRPGNTTTAVCASENGGANVVEDCVAANPAAGVWVVLVYAYTAHTGTAITATVTPTPP